MNQNESRQLRAYMKKKREDFRQLLEVADLENAYLRKTIEQLEKRLEDMEE